MSKDSTRKRLKVVKNRKEVAQVFEAHLNILIEGKSLGTHKRVNVDGKRPDLVFSRCPTGLV